MTTTTATIEAPTTTRTPGWAGAFAGLIGAAVALGVSELIAGVLSPGSSLIAAVGQTIIDLQPPGAKDFVVALFGTNDKLALEILVTGTALAIGALLGYLGRDRFAIAASGFVAFGIVGFLAVLRLPLGSATIGALSAGIAVIAGIQVMSWLMQTARRTETADPRAGMPDWSRRNLLLTGSAIGVAALAGGVVGRMFGARSSVAPPEANAQIPPASDLAAALPTGADLSPQVAGLTPIVVPNDCFYQIDTALLTPIVDSATWQLRIHGMVDRETTLTWDELLAMPLFEQYVTIACVSNEIGGNLVGNAKWTGVRLREVLDIAGVQAGADPARRPVGRRLDRGHADGLGHGPGPRADDRGAHERRPTAAPARVPGPADRSRVVRLRVGDQVAGRAGAHDPGCVQWLLGAARRSRGAETHSDRGRRAGGGAERGGGSGAGRGRRWG